MLIQNKTIPLLREFLQLAFRDPYSENQFRKKSSLVSQLTDSHYLSVLFFSNRHSPDIQYNSNNETRYRELYRKTLLHSDFILERMTATGNTTCLSSFKSDEYLQNRDFCARAIENRPISDICYVPLMIHGYLAGYIAVSRAGTDEKISRLLHLNTPDRRNRMFSPNDVSLIRFLAGIMIRSYSSVLERFQPDPETAFLDASGTILLAGDIMRETLRETFGISGWQRPLEGRGMNSAAFRCTFSNFISMPLMTNHNTLTVTSGAKRHTMRLMYLEDFTLRRHFPNEPVVCMKLDSANAQRSEEISRNGKLCEYYKFSSRETEVVNLVYRGHTNQEIAEILNLSLPTVKHHVASLFEKTGVHSRAQLFFALGTIS